MLLTSCLLSRNIKIRIHRIIIFSVVLYSLETWSKTLREQHRLRVFENRVLRIIFGPRRDEVAGGWRKLHNNELHNMYPSPSIIRMIKSRMRWARVISPMGQKKCRLLVGKLDGKRPRGRPRQRWEDNIKMALGGIGLGGGIDWSGWAQYRTSGGLL
jgi:hypothetical protein